MLNNGITKTHMRLKTYYLVHKKSKKLSYKTTRNKFTFSNRHKYFYLECKLINSHTKSNVIEFLSIIYIICYVLKHRYINYNNVSKIFYGFFT